MAVNGALGLFTNSGHWPTYWIACDPQELVTRFLDDALDGAPGTFQTTYLVASKCHPKVFERLSGYNVRLWHVNDQPIPGNHRTVPCAVSVTLCALMLAHRLGYRTINVWGWDCCFDGEKHHAAPSELSGTPERIRIGVGEPEDMFETTTTWWAEMEDAKKILPVLKWAGTDVRIHGRSLVSAILTEYAADA